ncbi:MAG: alpha/beta hydrolase [Spirochaetes bacterium]|nr:alpha/beta hydrolase [Spirochaetota bacterium]
MKLVIIPGLGDSGPEHWQTLWEKKFTGSIRVRQRDWDFPDLQSWIAALQTVVEAEHSNLILVGHSLGVALVAHWAAKHNATHVRGALLVSPSDVDSPAHTPEVVRGFAPMPLQKLPFKSIVVASSNDTFVSTERARFFANQWKSEFIDLGPQGHINAASGLGLWEEGQKILARLIPAYP